MDRRSFIGAAITAASLPLQAAQADSARALQRRIAQGKLSAEALTRQCLARIAATDKAGPAVNAIIELNPDAIAIAIALDAERAAGKPRGPLHGIPVVVKDVIATNDRMCTTAGSLALDGMRARRDAFLVTRLRAAGAIVLAKSNLTEWSNLRSPQSVTGWSGRGGLTRNPYALERSCGGSSSGSAAAVAAGMVPLAVGTETDGSIVCPASICGLVGIKPTVGLVSRSGVVRITSSMDTAGPLARTVADAALLLSAMAGADPQDSLTRASATDYERALDKDGLKGTRIGVVRNYFVRDADTVAQIESQLKVLKACDATLVDVELPGKGAYNDDVGQVLLTDFKAELQGWLADYVPHAAIKNIDDLIAFNRANAERELQHFGQELLQYTAKMGPVDSPSYRKALANCLRLTREEGIDAVMREHRLDALVGTTSVPAWVTEFGKKRGRGDPGFTTPAAVAGYPHITVPAGYVNGLPVGLSFVGAAWSEAALIRMAYAYEQATLHRREPQFAEKAG